MSSNVLMDPKINYPLPELQFNFPDYIQACRELIARTRLDLNSTHSSYSEHIVIANAPFEYKPLIKKEKKIKYGALLVHGLLDSCFSLKEIGAYLQTQELLVRSILLPGHGTVPGALLHVEYEQWLETVRYAVKALCNEVEEVFLVGYSTGGALIIDLMLKEALEQVRGMICLAPAIKIYSPFAFASRGHAHLGRIWPRAAWFSVAPEKDYVKYSSVPLNAVYQVYRLTHEIKKINPASLNCPLLFVLSEQDNIVNTKASMQFFEKTLNTKSKCILYSYSNKINNNRVILRPAIYPEFNITGVSHVGLPYSNQNIHYGQKGDYSEASHFPSQENVLYGEYYSSVASMSRYLYRRGLLSKYYARVSFNPDFNFLLNAIGEFVE